MYGIGLPNRSVVADPQLTAKLERGYTSPIMNSEEMRRHGYLASVVSQQEARERAGEYDEYFSTRALSELLRHYRISEADYTVARDKTFRATRDRILKLTGYTISPVNHNHNADAAAFVRSLVNKCRYARKCSKK